jgi:LmbE family N-acetylglucosaminyl deacetylase
MQLSSSDRVLIFSPHPDDETLAAGEAVQLALAAGAAVRVVFATDGDNNPWPQRWLERRWHIDAAARARWGARRRREALAALAVLGVTDASTVAFLGWPDQGLTACLMRDDAAVAALAREIAAFAPSHVLMPALGDLHPDHSALRVMLDLALARCGSAAVRLGYVVHGAAVAARACMVAPDAVRRAHKRRALFEHASQIALSRRRLLELAGRTERFEAAAAPAPVRLDVATVVRIAQRAGAPLRRRRELLLVLATRARTQRLRLALPRWPHGRTVLASGEGAAEVAIEWAGDAWLLQLPPLPSPLVGLYAKLDRAWPRLVVFDDEPWHDLGDLLPGAHPALAPHPATA